MRQLYLVAIQTPFGRKNDYFVGLLEGSIENMDPLQFYIPSVSPQIPDGSPKLIFQRFPIDSKLILEKQLLTKDRLQHILKQTDINLIYWQNWQIFLRYNPAQFLTAPSEKTRELIQYFLTEQWA